MKGLAALFVLFAPLTLASCDKANNSYQGWIEANLIFVGPDEVGRVQTLSVREGDVVKTGQPLFTVDDDLQQADLAQVKAALANAQQTFDRAQQLAKTGSAIRGVSGSLGRTRRSGVRGRLLLSPACENSVGPRERLSMSTIAGPGEAPSV
jgi:HlyD family secretion protein